LNPEKENEMTEQFIEIHLFAIFAGILLSIIFTSILKIRISPQNKIDQEIFSTGDIPPYNQMKSIRVRLFLPWTKLPNLSALGIVAATLFHSARITAWFAALALLHMIVLSVTHFLK
jgi:hypothetical protein